MPNPEFNKRLVTTLALQLAIFIRFHETMVDARKRAEEADGKARELEQQGKTLQRVFEDIRHQIKAPLDKALMQISDLASDPGILKNPSWLRTIKWRRTPLTRFGSM